MPLTHRVGAVPASGLGDPTRVRQILLNLLSNAIKLTAEGHVHRLADWDGAELRVEVQDTGLGIPPEELATLFDAIVQADTFTRHLGGSDLPLTIRKRLAEIMERTLAVPHPRPR